jgi:hypothetical protein
MVDSPRRQPLSTPKLPIISDSYQNKNGKEQTYSMSDDYAMLCAKCEDGAQWLNKSKIVSEELFEIVPTILVSCLRYANTRVETQPTTDAVTHLTDIVVRTVLANNWDTLSCKKLLHHIQVINCWTNFPADLVNANKFNAFLEQACNN